ncbi:reverse transcriptase domain-containing protein, partial [Tanacetum coccineum]
ADIDAGIAIVVVIAARETDVRVEVGIETEAEAGEEANGEIQPEGTIKIRVDVATEIDISYDSLILDAIERLGQLEEGMQAVYDHLQEIPLQRINDIDQIRDDNDNESGGNGNHGNNNGDGNQNGGNRGARINAPVARTIGINEAYEILWKDLMKLMIEVMVPEDNDKIERFIWGLPDNIQGNVTSSKPVRLQDDIRMANGLMDQKFLQNMAQAVTVGNNEKIGYVGSALYYNKCRLHHEGTCTLKCTNCKKGHYKSDCPKLKNRNRGNKAANNDARGRAYALGGGDGNPDSNVVTGTFLLNNHYVYILFDSGADRSFVSTMFSTLIDIPPTALDISYTVELADGQISESDTIIRGCTLNLLDHPFSTDLMPVDLGSFGVIIGMDWLSRYHAVIVCNKKIVRIPYGNEILTVRGDGSSKGSNSRLSIISCTKTKKYLQRGCHVILAQILVKKTEDKSDEKRLADVPIV